MVYFSKFIKPFFDCGVCAIFGVHVYLVVLKRSIIINNQAMW